MGGGQEKGSMCLACQKIHGRNGQFPWEEDQGGTQTGKIRTYNTGPGRDVFGRKPYMGVGHYCQAMGISQVGVCWYLAKTY